MPSVRSLLPLALGLTGCAMLVARLLTGPAVAADEAGPVLAQYRLAAAALPGEGAIGFVPAAAGFIDASAHRALVRYALAPRQVVDVLDEATGVVTAPAAPAGLDAEMSRQGLRLVYVTPGGVRVYQR